MALFQPTNITPDLKGGVKNGTFAAPYSGSLSAVDVSWAVNGNSPMTDYQIDFYKNDANSTYTGTTGKVTLATPFSAVAADGTLTRFSVSVPVYLFAQAINGSGTVREGKFRITQWWGSGADDCVVQRSLSVFHYSKEGLLSIDSMSGNGAVKTFSGSWSAPLASTFGNIALNWTRWQITQDVGDESVTIQDTGKVWGATAYTWTTDAIAPGSGYHAVFTAEASDGQEYQATYGGPSGFSVLTESAVTVSGVLTATCDNASGAVKVHKSDAETIVPEIVGTVTHDEDGRTILGNGSYMTIQIPGERFGGAKWSFIWHGLFAQGVPFFSIQCKDGTSVSVGYNHSLGEFFPDPAHDLSSGSETFSDDDEIYIVFTPGYFANNSTAGFQWIFISPDKSSSVNMRVASGYVQSPPISLKLWSNTTVIDFQFGFGPVNGFLNPASTATYEPDFAGPNIYYPTSAFHAEALYLGSQQVGVPVFRESDNQTSIFTTAGFFEHDVFTNTIYDYAAVNDTEISYQMVAENGENGNTAIATTGKLTPCLWEWELIEATEISGLSKKLYYAVRVFRFRNNASVSAIGNGNERSVYQSFTRYPIVMRGTQNRQAGTLSGLIGATKAGDYKDKNSIRDALYNLSTTRNALFLKSRRGDFMRIALSGEISMQTGNASVKQEQTASVPWVETASTEGVGVYGIGFEILNYGSGGSV